MVKVRKDLTGMVFGRLTVIKQVEDGIRPNGNHYAQWLCQCSCKEHNETVVCGYYLNEGITKSCGCLSRELAQKFQKKYNDYEVQEDYVIMYTSKGEPFFVDLEDFWKVKDICWYRDNKGYILSKIGKKSIEIHRVIMDCPNGFDVDHRYGASTRNDNRKYNLRIVTRSQNNMNKTTQKNNKSGASGVGKHSRVNKWYARITLNYQIIDLGLFSTKEEAVKARKEAENIYFGEMSYDNSQKKDNSS